MVTRLSNQNRIPFRPLRLVRHASFRIAVITIGLDWAAKFFFTLRLSDPTSLHHPPISMLPAFMGRLAVAVDGVFTSVKDGQVALALNHHYVGGWVQFAFVFAVVAVLCYYYYIGAGCFALKLKWEKWMFGALTGAALANVIEAILTGKATNWLQFTHGSGTLTLNFADLVIFGLLPVFLIMFTLRLLFVSLPVYSRS